MSWYSNIKIAELPQEWWRDYHYHFIQVVNFEFPQKAVMAEGYYPVKGTTPTICTDTGAPGQTVATNFGMAQATLIFRVTCNSRYYQCTVNLEFKDYIDKKQVQRQKGITRFKKTFNQPLNAIYITVYSRKATGQDAEVKHLAAHQRLDAAMFNPAAIVRYVKQLIQSDPPPNDGGDNQQPSLDPTPQPSRELQPA